MEERVCRIGLWIFGERRSFGQRRFGAFSNEENWSVLAMKKNEGVEVLEEED